MRLDRRKLRVLRRGLRRPRALWNLAKIKLLLPVLQRSDRVTITPAMLDIEPTAKCNIRCKYCQVTYWDRSAKVKNLTYEQFVQIVDQFPHVLQIKLQGMGEPFLNHDFFRMVAYADRKGITVRTFSNATLLSEELAERIVESPLAELTISVDAATKETFERIRSGADWDRVQENIHRLVRARRELGNGRDPLITIWMVATTENIGEFPELVRIAKHLGVDRLDLQNHLNFWGKEDYQEKMQRYSINREDTPTHYRPDVDRILNEARRVAKEIGMRMTIHTGNTLHAGDKCSWPWTSAYISADGFVVPCCVVANPEVMNFGNLFQDTFSSIQNREKYKALRRSFMEGTPPKMCDGCYLCPKESGLVTIPAPPRAAAASRIGAL